MSAPPMRPNFMINRPPLPPSQTSQQNAGQHQQMMFNPNFPPHFPQGPPRPFPPFQMHPYLPSQTNSELPFPQLFDPSQPVAGNPVRMFNKTIPSNFFMPMQHPPIPFPGHPGVFIPGMMPGMRPPQAMLRPELNSSGQNAAQSRMNVGPGGMMPMGRGMGFPGMPHSRSFGPGPGGQFIQPFGGMFGQPSMHLGSANPASRHSVVVLNPSSQKKGSVGFANDVTTISVAHILMSVGFERTNVSICTILADLLPLYLNLVATKVKSYAELSGRTTPNIEDVGYAFEDLSVDVGVLYEFAKAWLITTDSHKEQAGSRPTDEKNDEKEASTFPRLEPGTFPIKFEDLKKEKILTDKIQPQHRRPSLSSLLKKEKSIDFTATESKNDTPYLPPLPSTSKTSTAKSALVTPLSSPLDIFPNPSYPLLLPQPLPIHPLHISPLFPPDQFIRPPLRQGQIPNADQNKLQNSSAIKRRKTNPFINLVTYHNSKVQDRLNTDELRWSDDSNLLNEVVNRDDSSTDSDDELSDLLESALDSLSSSNSFTHLLPTQAALRFAQKRPASVTPLTSALESSSLYGNCGANAESGLASNIVKSVIPYMIPFFGLENARSTFESYKMQTKARIQPRLETSQLAAKEKEKPEEKTLEPLLLHSKVSISNPIKSQPPPKIKLKVIQLPKSDPAKSDQPRTTSTSTDQIHCVCPSPGCFHDDATFMVACDNCGVWFHGRCVGVLDGNLGEWFCGRCPRNATPKDVRVADLMIVDSPA